MTRLDDGQARRTAPRDVGTIWMMQRRDVMARCALFATSGGWEVRILIEDDAILSERCISAENAFALADQWKQRLLDQAWQAIVPIAADRLLQRQHPPRR